MCSHSLNNSNDENINIALKPSVPNETPIVKPMSSVNIVNKLESNKAENVDITTNLEHANIDDRDIIEPNNISGNSDGNTPRDKGDTSSGHLNKDAVIAKLKSFFKF